MFKNQHETDYFKKLEVRMKPWLKKKIFFYYLVGVAESNKYNGDSYKGSLPPYKKANKDFSVLLKSSI